MFIVPRTSFVLRENKKTARNAMRANAAQVWTIQHLKREHRKPRMSRPLTVSALVRLACLVITASAAESQAQVAKQPSAATSSHRTAKPAAVAPSPTPAPTSTPPTYTPPPPAPAPAPPTDVVISNSAIVASRPEPCRMPMANSGYVPDTKTAIAVAEAILLPIYGEAQIASERPFRAVSDKDVWTVTGSLPCNGGACFGGVALVRLSREDGRLLCIEHGR